MSEVAHPTNEVANLGEVLPRSSLMVQSSSIGKDTSRGQLDDGFDSPPIPVHALPISKIPVTS